MKIASMCAWSIAALLFASTFTACLDPTEVELLVTTDSCGSIAPVDIFLDDSNSPVASTTQCANGTVGKLVFVPSGSTEARIRVRVQTHLRDPDASCEQGKKNKCIEATRAIGFVRHARLQLPISLDRACAGVTCRVGYTCDRGNCVPEMTSCATNQTCTPDPDGGVEKPDSSIADAGPDASDADASGDSGAICFPPYVGDSGAPYTVWHFDDSPGMAMTSDTNLKCGSFGATIRAGTQPCGNELVTTTNATKLGCAMDQLLGGKTFRVAFWFFPQQANGNVLSKIDTTNSIGWAFAMESGGLAFVTTYDVNTQTHTALVPQIALGQWHRVDLKVANNLVQSITIDSTTKQPSVGVTSSVGGPFVAGPIQGALDELYTFP